jgi:general stress protein 26
MFIHVEGEANLIRDKGRFAEHWQDSLDRWFPQGIDTPGMVMIEVLAKRIHYWDGKEEGEVRLPAAAVA